MATVLLLLAHRENRRLLADLLVQHYDVHVSSPSLTPPSIEDKSSDPTGNRERTGVGYALLNNPFDLCILDSLALKAYWHDLHTRRTQEHPVFLPCLLLLSKGQPNMSTQACWRCVDEQIQLPVEKSELLTRLGVLMRSRSLSLQLKAANTQLQEMNQVKSQFISMVSHEFRNPLSAVSGFAQVMLRQGDKLSPETHQDYLHRIRDTVTRLTTLVDDVLIMGRVGRGKLAFEPQPLDLVAFCQRLIEEVKFGWNGDRAIQFKIVEGTEEHKNCLHQSYMDDTLLRHIFTNLLTNALKYSAADRPVQFTIQANLQPQGSTVHFSIQDQGIGIPEAEQTSLFTPFWRATNVGEVKGTGLGLAIAHQCVELHAGTVQCTSIEGQGTQFDVVLPLGNDQGEFGESICPHG